MDAITLNFVRPEDIIATLREPFLVLSKNCIVLAANSAFYATFHVREENTKGLLLYNLGNRQWDIPALRVILDEILPHNTIVKDFEVNHTFPEIGHRIMILNAARINHDGGTTEMILLAIEDITERRSAEEKRQELETRFTSLVKNIKEHSIFTTDPQGHITSWNDEAERILGYTESEVLGQSFAIIFPPEDIAKEVPNHELRTAKEFGRAEDERWHIRKNRELFWAMGILTPTYDATGHHTGFSKILRDTTDRKRLQEQLRQRVDELAQADRRKDEFLAMLSHELRNPIAPIMNAVELLSLHSINENAVQKKARNIIERQVSHLKIIVDDLLEVTRITTGRIKLHKETINVLAVVERAAESVQPLISQNKQELIVTVPPEPIWLHADATRIAQVLVNLLTNATKYTKPGGTIQLLVAVEDQKVIIRVQDTGVGIVPELLPRIFDLFMQAEQSLDRSNGGLGIGLTVVKKLVEMHEGQVKAHSILGKGSEFIVSLPISTVPNHSNNVENIPISTKSLRVLVVDDNLDTAESMTMLAQTAGHVVQTTHDGPSTLPTALDFHPNVILLDIGLPGLNGYEVAKQIRQQPTLKDVLLIALTGYGQEDDRRRSLEAGFDYHLVKPANFAKVQQILSLASEKLR